MLKEIKMKLFAAGFEIANEEGNYFDIMSKEKNMGCFMDGEMYFNLLLDPIEDNELVKKLFHVLEISLIDPQSN